MSATPTKPSPSPAPKPHSPFPREEIVELTYSSKNTDSDLLQRLRNISSATDIDGKLIDYLEIRVEACAISFELNRRGKIAPRFRELRRPPPTTITLRSDGDYALGTDRQVIDLHWLSCRGWEGKVLRREEFKQMFQGGVLRMGLADQFASLPAPFKEKVAWLSLPESLLLELDTLQLKSLQNRVAELQRGKTLKGELVAIGEVHVYNELIAARKSAASAEKLSKAWLCNRMADGDLEVARALHALAIGAKPLSLKAFVSALDQVNRFAPKPRNLVTSIRASKIQDEQRAESSDPGTENTERESMSHELETRTEELEFYAGTTAH